jgi:hypothetical protein
MANVDMDKLANDVASEPPAEVTRFAPKHRVRPLRELFAEIRRKNDEIKELIAEAERTLG